MSTADAAFLDGNEAVARVAYALNEVCAIYPITPSSPMGEWADQWAAEGRRNLWGSVPLVAEMQSEGGAAGALHGALQTGSLTTTFTASQGLLLMLPNMFKIAGELTPAVFHVAARSVACQALSIFGDHSDVMAVRSAGFAMLAASSPQEAHDFAAITQVATLASRVPFLHFFDGFRTSHEINRVQLLSEDDLGAIVDEDLVFAHRRRGLNPNRPVMRGTAQNPDVFFQARESVNPFYQQLPDLVQTAMDRFADRTGRAYHLFDYHGHPEAERVLVLMGSGAETARETVAHLQADGEAVGVLQVHLYRPFAVETFLAALPATVRRLAVLDRTKEPGATGEPLYQDVTVAVAESADTCIERVIGGRYGLSSKEFTPAMVKAVLDELREDTPRNHFTVGIRDDVSHTDLAWDPDFVIEDPRSLRAVFYGLGSDGTVGANKNSIKILGASGDRHAQAYFVYDSKKAGSRTVSHLRVSPVPIRSTYLVQRANFIACHQPAFLDRIDLLAQAETGATLLLNAPGPAESVWATLPRPLQQDIIDRQVRVFAVDAATIARACGLGPRINTVMQACFFALTDLLPGEAATQAIVAAIRKTYAGKGTQVILRNEAAVEQALAGLHEVPVPEQATSNRERQAAVPAEAPRFVREVTAALLDGKGDELPVSALPEDGTWPTDTARWEKRNIAFQVPAWEPDLCVQCGQCGFVCPHSCIRAKFFPEHHLETAPSDFPTAPLAGRGFPEVRYALHVDVEDCTGCGLCIEVCPARDPSASGRRAINLADKAPQLTGARARDQFFRDLPEDRSRIDYSTVRGVQYLTPLFEYPGACAGCGETPYLKLLSQLFGERLVIANATGCSSIYGGNLPTTPWARSPAGRGPAWSNSLFEDNAEFGFGFRLSADQQLSAAHDWLRELAPALGAEKVDEVLNAPQGTEPELAAQRERVEALRDRLQLLDSPLAPRLLAVLDHLVRRSIWIVGGDGWAYDIGYGGLDHVLACGRDVNVLVLDTEVYSNTGGQASKSTPLGAVAKFAAAGKSTGKKDLGLMAIAYGNVYVARIAMGANPQQTLLALREAEAWPGPSLVLAYSHCIAHGIDMRQGLQQQKRAADCGHWNLFRYNPALAEVNQAPFVLDSVERDLPFAEYANHELRYRILRHTHPERAAELMRRAQADVDRRWRIYQDLAETEPGDTP